MSFNLFRNRKLYQNALSISQMVKLAWQAHTLAFLTMVFLTALQGLLPLANAWLLKLLFDLLSSPVTGSIEAVTVSLITIVVLQSVLKVLGGAIGQISAFLNAELRRRLTLQIQTTICKKVNGFIGIEYFENPAFQDTLSLGTSGGENGPASAFGTFIGLLQNIVLLTGFLVVLLAWNPFLCVLVILTTLPQLYIQFKIGRERVHLATKLTPEQRRLAYYKQLLFGPGAVKEFRLFNLADRFLNWFLHLYHSIQADTRSQELSEMRQHLYLDVLANLVSGAVFIIVALQAFAGRITLGDVTLYVSAITSVQTGLSGLISSFATLHQQRLFFNYFEQLLNLPQPVTVANNFQPVPTFESGIRLQNVSFRYTEKHPWILRNVNLFIPKGKCVALVGLNGAGKTTVVKLLTRLYDPTEGRILWDGIDITQFDPQELRQRIGTVFQDYMRYALTVKENIDLGNVYQSNTLEQIQNAAKQAGAHKMIENLPQGYDTFLNRYMAENGNGVDLSGGEWQKIALARVFMRDADFLILDEPTAALDAETEDHIYTRFAELMHGRTSLLISHRFSTVRMADIIAVLEEGKIVAWGSHEQLIKQNGTYARLYQMQNAFLHTQKEKVI
jgi:ATP-binding cassette, subfamily B, bacterial